MFLFLEKLNAEKKLMMKRIKLVIVFYDIAAFYLDKVQFFLV